MCGLFGFDRLNATSEHRNYMCLDKFASCMFINEHLECPRKQNKWAHFSSIIGCMPRVESSCEIRQNHQTQCSASRDSKQTKLTSSITFRGGLIGVLAYQSREEEKRVFFSLSVPGEATTIAVQPPSSSQAIWAGCLCGSCL